MLSGHLLQVLTRDKLLSAVVTREKLLPVLVGLICVKWAPVVS